MAKNQSVLDLLEAFGHELTKQAEAEVGETKPATTGSRASENSADVKSQVPGTSVDEADNNGPTEGGGENAPVNSIGTNKTDTGKDVPSTKSTKDDPGTTHIAKAATANDLIVGGNQLLAEIAIFSKTSFDKKANVAPATVKVEADKKEKVAASVAENVSSSKSGTNATSDDTVSIKKAEYEALKTSQAQLEEFVGYLTGQQVSNEILEKAATNVAAEDDELVKIAQAEAAATYALANKHTTDLVEFLVGFAQEKQAMDEAAMLAGAGGGEGGAPPMDPAAAMMGVDPAAGGGMPGAEGGAPGAGGELDPETLALLIQLLQQEGVNPEGLDAGGAALDAAGGGGTPPEQAGIPGGEAPPVAPEGGDEGGGGGDGIDDARAAAAGETGSDDESKGAKKEANKKSEKPKEEGADKKANFDMKKVAHLFAQFCKVAATKAQKSS